MTTKFGSQLHLGELTRMGPNLSTTRVPMATKLGRIDLACYYYNDQCYSTLWPRCLVGLRDKLKLQLHYHDANGHLAWQGYDLT